MIEDPKVGQRVVNSWDRFGTIEALCGHEALVSFDRPIVAGQPECRWIRLHRLRDADAYVASLNRVSA